MNEIDSRRTWQRVLEQVEYAVTEVCVVDDWSKTQLLELRHGLRCGELLRIREAVDGARFDSVGAMRER